MNDPVASASVTLAGRWRADAASNPIDRRHRLLDAGTHKWSHGRRAPTENALAYDPQYCNTFIQDAIATVYHSARWTPGAKKTKKTTRSPPKASVDNRRPTSATSVRRTLVDKPIDHPMDVATMVYRAPMFKAPHLQALEAETYSLLDATDVPYKHRLPRGPGISAARLHSATSRRQRPQSAGITRPRPKTPKPTSCRRLEHACRVIYAFVCRRFLQRKLQRAKELEDRQHAAARRLQVWFRRRRRKHIRSKSPTRTRLRANGKPKLRRHRPPAPEPVRQQKRAQRAPRDIETEAINTYLLARLLARPGDPGQKKKPSRKSRPLCRFLHPSRYLTARVVSSIDKVTVLARCAPRIAIPAYVLSTRTVLAPSLVAVVDDNTASTLVLTPSTPDVQLPVSMEPNNRVFATADRLQLMLFRKTSEATLQQCLDILADDASESTISDVRDTAASSPDDDDDDSTPRRPVLLRRDSSLPCLAMQCTIAAAAASTIQRVYGQYCRRQSRAAVRIQRQYRVHVVRADIRLGLKTLRAQHRRITRQRAPPQRRKTRGWSTLYLVLRLQQIVHRRVAKWRQSQRTHSSASLTAVTSIQRWYRHWKVAPTIAVDDLPPVVDRVDVDGYAMADEYAIAMTPLATSPVRVPNDDDTAHWTQAIDADGNVYYFNAMTRETTWDPPRGWQPPTWETCVDANGTVYYYNRATNESVWELPQTPAL